MLLKLEKPFSGGSLVKKGPKLPKRCLYVAHYLVNYSLWANFRDSLLTSCFAPIALFSFPFAGFQDLFDNGNLLSISKMTSVTIRRRFVVSVPPYVAC